MLCRKFELIPIEIGFFNEYTTTVYHHCLPPLLTTAAYHRCLPPLLTTAAYHRCFRNWLIIKNGHNSKI